jgi:hypothetical protein
VKTFDPQRLATIFHSTCMRDWSREEIARHSLFRFAQTYLMMASAHYRPGAPGDGMGNIHLSREELADRDRLYREAVEYAIGFRKEEDGHEFWVGCSDYETNRAFMLAIEVARLLAGGLGGEKYALRLLRMAIQEIENAVRERQRRHSGKECVR